MKNHVLERGHGSDVTLVASRRAEQIHHIFSRIDARKRHISIFIRVGMPGHIALVRLARVLHHIGLFHAIYSGVHFGLEDRRKWRTLCRTGKHDVLPPVRTTLRSARGFGVCEILHQQFRARTLRRHAGCTYRKHREQAHLPSWIAELISFNWDRIRFVAKLNRRAFSASNRASRSILTLLPSLFTNRPGASTTFAGASLVRLMNSN